MKQDACQVGFMADEASGGLRFMAFCSGLSINFKCALFMHSLAILDFNVLGLSPETLALLRS